ncbi:hypothetical protein [Rheinheimera fenheensis]|uniref:hypothetical protein n=1 Tax=Rheinheimera fenheensis TaxID=3152295 RepID=UPI00325E9D9C
MTLAEMQTRLKLMGLPQYIPVLQYIKLNSEGIAERWPELDPLDFLAALFSQTKRPVDEAYLVLHLLELPIHHYEISNEEGQVWSICLEPFSEFTEKSDSIAIEKKRLDKQDRLAFFNWLVALSTLDTYHTSECLSVN